MTNKEIARAFNQLAKLLELEGENPYKIRSYQSAYAMINKMGTPLAEMSADQIKSLKGVGKAIAGKIDELLTAGKMSTLERYKAEVPAGILEMLDIKGLGPKKIKTVWQQLGVESATELLYACNENRLIELTGFGVKTQEEIKKQLEFFLRNRSKFLYVNIRDLAADLKVNLEQVLPGKRVEFTGSLRRFEPVLERLDYLIESSGWPEDLDDLEEFRIEDRGDSYADILYREVPVRIYVTETSGFEWQWFLTTGPKGLVERLGNNTYSSEESCFTHINLPYLTPETRDLAAESGDLPDELVTMEKIRGVLHTHSTYSDGVNNLAEMAAYSKARGFDYLGISDHSQIAVYANGITEEELVQQWSEIDELNAHSEDFRILKGIECDILNDGSLDFGDDVLEKFDFVISSVHTNIKMDEAKATDRIIAAVEHPETNILGHPTGRLLLGRAGYPVDLAKVIDACAANKVAIELNASPYRLDLDWRWIRYAREKGVMISINPDAHAREAIDNIDFGVIIARKGWLDREGCLNTLPAGEFIDWCSK